MCESIGNASGQQEEAQAIVCSSCSDVLESEADLCECCNACESCCSCNQCRGCGNRSPAHPTEEELCSRCERCPNHCECSHCDACGDPCEYTCERCQYCDDCCECCHCQNCGCTVGHSSFCGQCDCCVDCCECESSNDRAVEFVNRGLYFHTATRTQHSRNPSSRYIACEIEIANADDGNAIDSAARKWRCSIVEDSSLPSTGFELVTAPASGDLFAEQIQDICTAFHNDGAEVNAKCGLHVHIDARDFRYWDIRRLIHLYYKIEDALFHLVPLSRRNNNYCLPCGARYYSAISGSAKRYKEGLLKSLYGSRDSARYSKREKYCPCRYNALNLHSWLYRGTVEFRLGAGTTDARKITCWGMLLAAIIDYTAKHSDREIDSLSGDALDILRIIAPTAEVCVWLEERYEKFNY